jgi:HPt (histidine-containing phosphotransfer) domain-containing protein
MSEELTPAPPKTITDPRGKFRKYTPEQVRLGLLTLLRFSSPQRASEFLTSEYNLEVSPSLLTKWRRQVHVELYHDLAAEYHQIFEKAGAAEAEDVVRRATELEQRLMDKIEENLDALPARDLANALRNVSTTKGINLERIASPLRGRATGIIQHQSAKEIEQRLLERGVLVEGEAVDAEVVEPEQLPEASE